VAELSRAVREALSPYRQLLQDFISGDLTADEVDTEYTALYCNDPTDWPDDVFRVIDDFFLSAEGYVADDALRTEVEDLDAEELHTRAVASLQRLDALS
jgi:hypothetical protein